MFTRWQYRRGFHAALTDCHTKVFRTTDPRSLFGRGYRAGIAAYARGLDPEVALADALDREFFAPTQKHPTRHSN